MKQKQSAGATETVKRRRRTEVPEDYHQIGLLGEGSSHHTPSSQFVVPHPRVDGLFVGNENALYTKKLKDDGTEVEYREWNPSRSKLAAAIICGADSIWMKTGSRVLYMGDVCETTLSHISDLVGHEGLVYAVALKNGHAIEKMAHIERRSNITTIIASSNAPWKFRMLIEKVDVIVGTMDTDAQIRGVHLNAQYFLKSGGHYMILIKANRTGLTSHGEVVFTVLGKKFQREFKPLQQVPLEPFDQNHAYIIGEFRSLEAVSF